MNPTTYNLLGITENDCSLIATALDFYLCNAEVPEGNMQAATDWLIEFDLMADPGLVEEIINENNEFPQGPRITKVEGNLISVDFSNKSV